MNRERAPRCVHMKGLVLATTFRSEPPSHRGTFAKIEFQARLTKITLRRLCLSAAGAAAADRLRDRAQEQHVYGKACGERRDPQANPLHLVLTELSVEPSL
jgi:hypothetical protein